MQIVLRLIKTIKLSTAELSLLCLTLFIGTSKTCIEAQITTYLPRLAEAETLGTLS